MVCVQNRYGLGFHDPATDELLARCREQGIAFVPFYALAGEEGPRGGASTAHEEEVRAVAGAHGVSPAQVRIAWTLHQGPHVLAIPGTGDLGHLAENVARAPCGSPTGNSRGSTRPDRLSRATRSRRRPA